MKTPTRLFVIAAIAAIPSALSLVWTAWSVADMIPAPWAVGLAVGVVLDLALIAAVAIAWRAPAVAGPATGVAWVIAVIAAIAVGVHGWMISPAVALFGVLPLISKGMWHLALAAQRADEAARADQAAQEQRLSGALTLKQRIELAELEQKRTYITERTSRELALEDARARAEQDRALAEVRRQAELEIARVDAQADIRVRRAEAQSRVELAAPIVPRELPPSRVPDGLSWPDLAEEAGFAAGFTAAAAPRTGGDTPAPATARRTRGTRQSQDEAERNRRAVLAAWERLSAGGTTPSVTAVATEAGVSRRTVNRCLATVRDRVS